MNFSVLAVGERGRESGKGNVVRIKVVFCTAHCTVYCVCSSSLPTAGGGGDHIPGVSFPLVVHLREKRKGFFSASSKMLWFFSPFEMLKTDESDVKRFFLSEKKLALNCPLSRGKKSWNYGRDFRLHARGQLGQLPMCSTSSTPNRCFNVTTASVRLESLLSLAPSHSHADLNFSDPTFLFWLVFY